MTSIGALQGLCRRIGTATIGGVNMLSRSLIVCAAVAANDAFAQPDLTYAVPGTDTVVRAGAAAASVSRDSGRTWSPLLPPQRLLMVRHGAFDPVAGATVPASLRAPAATRLFLVQFQTQILDEYRAGLRALDARIHQHLPHQTYLVRMDPARVPAVRELPYVRHVGAYDTFFRIEPEVVAALLRDSLARRRYLIALVDKHADAAALAAAVVAAGGVVEAPANGGLLVEATLTPQQLVAVAGRDEVLYVDRSTAIEFDMDNARIQSGLDYVEMVSGIDGKGMTGHVAEGVHATHPEFAARPPYRTAPVGVRSTATSSHGTNTAGEIYAMGGLNPLVKGGSPFAQMYFTSSGTVGTDRYGLTRDLVDPAGSYRVMFQTASWGYTRTLMYTNRSAEMDDIIDDLQLYITQSQSNAGSTSQPRDSRPQAWSKGIASVGGFRHYDNSNPADDAWANSGSTGPAWDGRIGVTFSGYYDSIATTSGSTGYTTSFGGTSGATPLVNGLSACAIQMFAEGLFGYPAAPSWQNIFDHLPQYTTTKTLLMATTRQIPFNRSDRYQQGWGFPNVGDLYDLRDRLLVIDELDVLAQGGSVSYFLYVEDSFRAALTWNEPEAVANAAIHRHNSIDLEVVLPDGTRYWGNNGLLAGLTSTPGGVANDRDTEEMVIIDNPPAGIYEVRVSAPAIRRDGNVSTPAVDQDFGLTVRGAAGIRDVSGTRLDLVSTAPGDLRVSLTNLPAGYGYGVVAYSLATTRPLATGNWLGLQLDGLALASLTQVPGLGSPFAFLATGNGSLFPNATYAFPPAVAAALSGRDLDAVAAFFVGAQAVGASNVDRVSVR